MNKRRRGCGCLVTIIASLAIAFGIFHLGGKIIPPINNLIHDSLFHNNSAITLGSEIHSEHAALVDLSTGRVICV